MLRMCAYRDDLAIAQWGAFDIVISIAQQLCNSNIQQVSMSIMTPKQTGAIGQPKLMLYSLFIQPPGRNSGMLAMVTCDQMHHMLFCMGHLGILPTMHIQGRPHESPPGRPHRDSFVVDNDESIPKREWTPGTQTGRKEQFRMISPVPSHINLSTPPPRPPSDGHFTPQLEQSDYPADEGWQWQEEIQAWANPHHVLSPMGFKCQKQNPPNPPQQNSPIPHIPCEQASWQPTPGPSGTQWLEDLSCEPSQHNEPPIPGLSPSSEPPEDVLTHEPETEVAPTQCTKEPFGKSPLLFLYSYQLFLTPPLTISSLSRYSPLCNHHQRYAHRIPPGVTPHSHDDTCQEFTDLQMTLMIP
ncbi:hypothetical protein O181_052971 [Austropuccinia psidii MF-1]|uniref:Uncharacterized protein n=1 Tax=Austropuccinia psidii MF-1 TaxID=1389203 RepID=A0A9Q3DZJ6_9BASI|nr:hypothetical protein [Austropuccinia psidii MF-1]